MPTPEFLQITRASAMKPKDVLLLLSEPYELRPESFTSPESVLFITYSPEKRART